MVTISVIGSKMARVGMRWGVALVLAASVLVACSPGAAPPSPRVEVPLPAGKQTTLVSDPVGFQSIGVDASGVLYLGAVSGVSTLRPGAPRPSPLPLNGVSTMATMTPGPDGRLYFATLDGIVETVAPGATTPQRLPFNRLQRFSQIAVGHDGTVYLGDDARDVMLALSPGAAGATPLPVEVDGPGHMVVGADDELFVLTRSGVVRIARNATSAEPVAGTNGDVGGLAIDAAGNLYATDLKAGTVSRMPAAGGDWVRLPFTGLRGPGAVAVDRDGNVYVVDQGRRVVELAAK